MSTAVRERPGSARVPGGGVPARRAVIRWAVRLLRREWRQQFLILALVTVAVAATVLAATVATNTPAPVAGVLGTAQDAAALSGPPATISAGITELGHRYGATDVIENESVQIPGTLNTFDLRAQDTRGPFGGPMLTLVSGQYPAAAGQIAVTSGVAAAFRLSVGSTWTVADRAWKVTGIVANPQSLLDEFALVLPGQVTAPDNATVLFDAPGQSASRLQSSTGLHVTTARTVANTNEINPQTISVAAAVLGMLLIALVGIGGFTVLAQRRLRAIGMLAAQGATQQNIGLVVRANGAATGVVGAVAGFALGFLAWLAYRPQAEQSAHHLMGVFQLPWTVIGIAMALAVIATYFAASRPANAMARTPIVAALAGRAPVPRKTRRLAVPVGLDYAGPNLTSSQLVVYAPCDDCGPGPGGAPGRGNTPLVSTAQARQKAAEIAADLGTSGMTTLETTSAGLTHAAPGRSWSGPVYVATPQLLRAFGITGSEISPGADILTMRPGLSTMSLMQLTYGGKGPGGTARAVTSGPAPNTVITEHAVATLGLQSSLSTAGWLIQVPNGLTAGIVLALGILGLSVGLVRSEAGRTAGALAFTGAAVGIVGGYLAAIGFFRTNQLDALSSLSSIPVANLLLILIGMPAAAVIIGWLVAGREPANLSRQPLE